MPQPKNIAFLLLLFAAISCKKSNSLQSKTGIYKIAGPRTWKGTLSIDFNPKQWAFHPGTSYDITFSNAIYVLSDSTISYSSGSIGNVYIDSGILPLDFFYVDLQYGFNLYTHSHSEVMTYYYKLDSLGWVRLWITDSNWRYSMSVHSP